MIPETTSLNTFNASSSSSNPIPDISSLCLDDFAKTEIAIPGNGKVILVDFLKEFLSQLKISSLGAPTRFDLIGSTLVSLLENGEPIKDIDIAVDYPNNCTNKLSLVYEILKKTLTECNIHLKNLDAIKRIKLDEPGFKAVIFTFGNDTLKLDITVATEKRGYLFSRDDLRGSLIPFLEKGQGIVLESIAHDPKTVLQHRRAKRIVIDHPKGINYLGLPTLFLLLAKGEELESPEAVNTLIETFITHVQKGKSGSLQVLKHVFQNHGNPLKQLKSRYYLIAFLALIGKCSDKELQYFAQECSNDKESPEAHFLRFCASSINHRVRKAHLLSIAALLKMSIWLVPDSNSWIHFISVLKDLATIEKDLPLFFKETSLKRLVFLRLLDQEFSTFFNQKRALDTLFDSLSDEEICKWLLERLSTELLQDPKVAFETAKKYSRFLSIDEKWRLLKGVQPGRESLTFEFLDQEYENSDTSSQLILKGIQEPLKVAFLKDKIAKITTPLEAQKLVLVLESSQLDSCNEEFIHAASRYPENVKLGLYLRLYPTLNEKSQKTVLAELVNHFTKTALKTIAQDDKKTVEKIWFLIWQALPRDRQNSFIDQLKKSKASLKINGSTSFKGGLRELDHLSKNIFMDEPARKSLLQARILQAEEEGNFSLSKKLFLQNPLILNEESDLLDFYAKSKMDSPLKALLFLQLKEPPLEDLLLCAKTSLLEKDFDTLLKLVRKGLEAKKFEETLLSDYLKTDLCYEEKASLLSDFPQYITPNRLKTIQLSRLQKESAARLFSAILSSPEPSENRSSLRALAKIIPSSRIAIHFPSLIWACGKDKDEVLFWAEKPTLTEWLSVGKKRALESLPYIKEHFSLEPILIALFIQIATQESLKEAIITLSLKEPHLLYTLALPLLEKMALLDLPMTEVAAPLDKIIHQITSLPTEEILLNNCKRVICKNRSAQYLNLYIRLCKKEAASEIDLCHIKLWIEELINNRPPSELLTLSFDLLPEPFVKDTASAILKKLKDSDSGEIEWTQFIQKMWDLQDSGSSLSLPRLLKMIYDNIKQSSKDPVVEKIAATLFSYISKSVMSWKTLQTVLTLIEIFPERLRQNWLTFALKWPSDLATSTAKETAAIKENCFNRLVSLISKNPDTYAADFLSLFHNLSDSLRELSGNDHSFSILISGASFLVDKTLDEGLRPKLWELLSRVARALCGHIRDFDLATQEKAAHFLLYFIKYGEKLDETQTKKHRELNELIFDNLIAASFYPKQAVDFLEICWASRLPCRVKEGFNFMIQTLEDLDTYKVLEKETLLAESISNILKRLTNIGSEIAKEYALELFEFIIKRKDPLLEKAVISAIKLTGDFIIMPHVLSREIELPDLFKGIMAKEISDRIETKTSESARFLIQLVGLYGNFSCDWIKHKNKDYATEIKEYFFTAINQGFFSGNRKGLLYFQIDLFSNLLLENYDLTAFKKMFDPIGEVFVAFNKSDIKTDEERRVHLYWTNAWIHKHELHYKWEIKKVSMDDATKKLDEIWRSRTSTKGFVDMSYMYDYYIDNPSVRTLVCENTLL